MRAKSTRIILLTDFPEVENPGGIIAPPTPTIIRGARSERTLLWNMQKDSEVPGTVAVNRSILWDVQAEGGPELTNYIEIPFFQWNWFNDEPAPGGGESKKPITEFKGSVRLWESGTVQFIGEVRGLYTGEDYQVAIGDPGLEVPVVVATAPTPTVWGEWGASQAVDWSYRLTGSQVFRLLVGGTTQPEILAYPGGWQLPFTMTAAAAGGVFITGDVSRSGNDLVISGNFNYLGIASAQGVVASHTMDTTGWNPLFLIDTVVHAGAQFGSYGPFTRTIPDSPTHGAEFHVGASVGTGGFGVSNGLALFGPIFREAYSTPTIQQGIDPEG